MINSTLQDVVDLTRCCLGSASPFRIDVNEFGFSQRLGDINDDDEYQEDDYEDDQNVSSSQNEAILSSILTQVTFFLLFV